MALLGALAGCAGVQIDPTLYQARTVALASVHARRTIDMNGVGVSPFFLRNDLGDEVIEMSLGDTEGALEELLGATVIPLGKALEQRTYDGLPEALPPEAWTQVNGIIAVDVRSPRAAPALGALAAAMGVDAVVVLRHEWELARGRLEVTEGVSVYDRCSILVVDPQGRVLWDDVVVARLPVTRLWMSQVAVGVNGASWLDEARHLARRASREALRMLAQRYAEGRRAPPAS